MIDTFMIEDVINEFTWSFSRLNSFYTCPRMWYIQYILKHEDKGNFFSDYGTHFHKMMELYDKGKLELFELTDYYTDNFNTAVCHDAPPNKYVNLRDSYYEKGLKYLQSFDGHPTETIGVEMKIEYDVDLGDRPIHLIGYIDRLSKDENGIIMTDYKSKSKFTSKKEKEHYLLQLYLYSVGVFKEYGEYPYKLQFDMFKECIIVEELFQRSKMENALQWVRDTIATILSEKEFPRQCDDIDNNFFCRNLCGYHTKCVDMMLEENK